MNEKAASATGDDSFQTQAISSDVLGPSLNSVPVNNTELNFTGVCDLAAETEQES